MFRISRFGELLKLLPRGAFDRAVENVGADRYRKRFSCWQQLVAMLYGQFSGATSLRVLERGFNAQCAHHYHLGCKELRRSTLADSNAKDSCVAGFEALASELMKQARGQLRQEGEELLQLLDSSSITVKGPGAQWAKHTRTPRAPGVKLHLLLGGTQDAPLAAHLSDANVNDIEYARRLELEADGIYVFDKGYCNYTWWWEIQQSGARFVTRFKRNAKLEVLQRRKIARNAAGIILKDELVYLSNKNPGAGRKNPYKGPLRRIEVAREGKPSLVLATNDLKSAALKIAERYKQRWQIELFFKWIKQHLRIKRLFGRSRSAVYVQILSALIAYLLVAIYARTHGIVTSLRLVLAELSATLFQRPQSEFHRHRRRQEQQAAFKSMQATLFT